MAPVTVTSIDHIVLTVRSLSTTIDFYTRHLGMNHHTFTSRGSDRHALTFGTQKLHLHRVGHEPDPGARNPQPGSQDLCFVTEQPVSEVLEAWMQGGVAVVEGGEVVETSGPVGMIKSVYCRDPDGNLIEVSNQV